MPYSKDHPKFVGFDKWLSDYKNTELNHNYKAHEQQSANKWTDEEVLKLIESMSVSNDNHGYRSFGISLNNKRCWFNNKHWVTSIEILENHKLLTLKNK